MKPFSWTDTSQFQWDERAKSWHAKSLNMWLNGSRKEIIPFIENYIPKGKFLDLGCGDGFGSYLLFEKGYDVSGIDISEKMIQYAKKKETNHLTFYQGDMLDLPFNDEEFTGMMAINSLEWTERPLDALNEVKRVMKDNGFGCFGILGPTAMPRINSFSRLEGKDTICNTMMPWEFLKLATENGWELIAEKEVYKKEVTDIHVTGLSNKLKQALSFMTIFILKVK
ncbi:class I SAM-dependent methyltransferase [Heyndrickxia oleronia]|uniref:class I SAM-dependent methyltransferase n=1 Tax=Heyndrickxia oleronia TaxID=38875 RepID=UPI00203A79C7|nr:class I SAM-dependent methyltransferase [Heyndrickxia oleronia]MCM3236748.1 class I SAM-dependent methyltransferase [Heyndrickxia oleronia]